MLKVNKSRERIIKAKDLKSGQLAVITEDFSDYKGRIVQKHGDHLIAIGLPPGCSWSAGAETVSLEVRILEEGETLTVTNNE